ncbi:MAG: dehydrogenase [Bacteroidales bacterium]|nr:dehydrogenase [Bacteroidales bacterium]
MSSLSKILILISMAIIGSCQANPVMDMDNDSTVTPLPERVYSMLPDTTLPSVDALEWKVEVLDTVNSGTLDTLRSLYDDAPGIFTFRGNVFRDAPFVGHVNGTPDTILLDWQFTTGYDSRNTDYGVWGGGTGWTGQPLYVRWPDSLMTRFRNESNALTRSFSQEEIIVGSLASRVYFINFATGDSSRRSLPTRNPIKGTVSLDPTLNGNLYVGQGIPAKHPFGALTFNLFSHSETNFFPHDKKAWRKWGAYDSSPIRVAQFLFRPGENGTLYKFLVKGDTLKLHSTLQFRKRHSSAAGMEASMSVYNNYGYISDNHGNILCVNLNTMHPVWRYDNHDDSDGSPVLAIEDGVPYLYSACELDKQGGKGKCYFVKLNALNGELVWEQTFSCKITTSNGKKREGGQFATPLLGRGNCDSIIFTHIVTNEKPGLRGDFVAISRNDGHVVYTLHMDHYAWSSPVALLNDNSEMFIFTGDTRGRAYLIEAKSGKILCSRKVGNNFEGSPIVIGNSIVVGSRGRTIYKLKIQ